MRRTYSFSILALAAAFGLTACQGSGGIVQVNGKLTEISDKQDQILTKVAELEKKLEEIKNLPAAAPAKGQQPPGQQGPRPGKPDPASTYKVPVGDAVTRGSGEALVTIVTWSDFQCPFCSRVLPTMKELEDAYGDKLRLAFKHNPLGFHPRALPAALAAEAAGKQGKFWEMHDKLFANNKELTDENFIKWAGEIGLDVEKFKTDMKDPNLDKKVKAQQTEGMSVGVSGTPAFFINGRFLSGAQPTDSFKKLVDEELAKAQKLVDAGTPKASVYEKVIEKGKTKV